MDKFRHDIDLSSEWQAPLIQSPVGSNIIPQRLNTVAVSNLPTNRPLLSSIFSTSLAGPSPPSTLRSCPRTTFVRRQFRPRERVVSSLSADQASPIAKAIRLQIRSDFSLTLLSFRSFTLMTVCSAARYGSRIPLGLCLSSRDTHLGVWAP